MFRLFIDIVSFFSNSMMVTDMNVVFKKEIISSNFYINFDFINIDMGQCLLSTNLHKSASDSNMEALPPLTWLYIHLTMNKTISFRMLPYSEALLLLDNLYIYFIYFIQFGIFIFILLLFSLLFFSFRGTQKCTHKCLH